MEFANRKACVEHYQAQFGNLPRYMIEMALDYDLATSDGAASNEKPLTGKEKRRLKQAKQEHVPIERELTKQIQEALKEGKRLEIDSAQVVRVEDYVEPPKMKGYINADGVDAAEQLKLLNQEQVSEPIVIEEEGSTIEEIGFDAVF